MISLSNLIKAPYIQVGKSYTLDAKQMMISEPRAPESAGAAAPDVGQETLAKAAQMLAAVEAQTETILAQSRQQAAKLLADAKQEASVICQKAHDDGYQAGNALGYEEGYNAGFASGESKAYQEGQGASKALASALADYEKQWQTLLAQNIDDLKYLALEIAEKIVDDHVATHPEFYNKMVDKALESFRSYQWVDIYIAEQPELAVQLESHLADVMAASSACLRIRQDKEAPPGRCIIESDAGVVDASVSTQLIQASSILGEEQEENGC